MTDEEPLMDWDEALAHVMRVTGKSRRQATAVLVEMCRSGKLPSFGRRPDTGKVERIPPEAWPKVH